MNKRQLSDIVIFWVLLTALRGDVEASPTKRLSRMVREVYPEIEPESEGSQAQVCIVGDVVYGADEPVPAEQPCLKCRCQPPGVQCETIQCIKKPGCKAIHKSNNCCPEYQCECEHNGKLYANGEKLETPLGGECKVCYCRGGEVQCAEVSCYVRKDCEGKRVPGKCCPKYDHCPLIDPLPGRSPYTTEVSPVSSNKESFETWSSTRVSTNTTDDILSSTSIDTQDDNKIPDTNYYELTTPNYKLTEVDLQKEPFLPKITIQEIIPERKEIPITAPPKVKVESQGTLIIEEAEEFLNHSNDLVVTDADADSSEISEVFQHPPPVLRIGDKLLFLKKGEFVPEKDTSTPNSVITIIGAEGLQRGGFEDSGEVHEVKIESIPEINDKDFNSTILPENVDPLSEDKTFANNPDQSLDPNNPSELSTAESTHILSLVKKKNKPSTTTTTTTEATTTTTAVNSTTESEIVSPTTDTSVLQDASSQHPITPRDISNDTSTTTESNDVSKTTTDALDTLTTEEFRSIAQATPIIEIDNTTNVEDKDLSSISSNTKMYEVVLEQNPAYPPIPDIMTANTDDTSQRFDTDHTEKEHTVDELSPVTPNIKILPVVLEIRSNKTVPKNTSHSDWLKVNTETLINYKAALPEDVLNQPAASDSDDTTVTNLNHTNFTVPDTTTETVTTNEVTDITTGTSEVVTDFNKKLETIIMATTNLPDKEEIARSTESMEELSEENRESTTKKSNHASITNENASLENAKDDSSEAEDMSSTKDTANDHSGEETTPSTLGDSGVIDKEWNDPNKNDTNGNSKDVELVDAVKSKKPVIERSVDTITPEEHLPKPEKLVLPLKIVSKRESNPAEKTESANKQQSKEISSEGTDRSLSSEENDGESEDIFKQLLEDTSTAKPKTRMSSDQIVSVLRQLGNTFPENRGRDPSFALLRLVNTFYPKYSSK